VGGAPPNQAFRPFRKDDSSRFRDSLLVHHSSVDFRHAYAGPPKVEGYRLFGAEFKHWVTLDEVDEDLLKSAAGGMPKGSGLPWHRGG
jgi:hypothetical protein